MNLAEIETFLMIVKTRNITKTAENLFLSQPTVSHRLKVLEEELEVQLLVRKKGHKKIELTVQGEEFIPIAERWISVWQEMQLLKNDKDKMYLTIGCTDTLNSAILFELYRKLLRPDAPLTNLKIKTHYSHEVYRLLENHEIDIGFVYHHLDFKNIIAEPVLSEKMYIIQSGSPKCKKNAIHTDELDLNNELFVSWEANYQIWHNQWVSKGIRPLIEVDTFELLLHLTEDERMWFIAPISVVDRLRELRPLFISEIANEIPPPERITYKITHKNPNEVTLKAVKLFEEEMLQFLSKKDWGFLK